MQAPHWIGVLWPPKVAGEAPSFRRDRIALLLAVTTFIGLVAAFVGSSGLQLLMPGPLTSAHGAIKDCSGCHTKSGTGKISWVHGLVAGDPLADSKACLTCHKMPDTAFNAHGAAADILKQSTERLTTVAARTPAPPSARAQSAAFPAHDMAARGIFCATCHQEHNGAAFNLARITNEQCRSCHVVKFDSFDGKHPKFEQYPFKQRTPIVYDHASHFGKHFPEVLKKDPARRIPATCSTCHDSRADKRVMGVTPFDQTCSSCHLNQIVGNERASGPKGVAFLTLPGLDLPTLKKKNAAIGEWPDSSEAELSPFMKVMISRNEAGRSLVKAVDGLNLQDLGTASGDQIKAVTKLVWEIKALYYALITKKASDVLADLNIVSGAKLSPDLVADLTASIPRDVIASAQQQWLPNLAAEMANRPAAADAASAERSAPRAVSPGPDTQPANSGSPPRSGQSDGNKASAPDTAPVKGKSDRDARAIPPPPMRAGLGDTLILAQAESTETEGEQTGGPITKRWNLPNGTSRSIEARGKKAPDPDPPSRRGESAKQPATQDTGGAAPRDAGTAAPAPRQGTTETPAVAEPPPDKAAAQTDDLLFPTDAEVRAMKAGPSASGPPANATLSPAASTAPKGGPTEAASTDTERKATAAEPNAKDDKSKSALKAIPVASIESDIDPETWAEYGGWYRQDYAIYYRPTGHKDKFIHAWLFLTGPQAPKGATSPQAAVFDYLIGKDAQGSCTKCHSVDDIPGKGRAVNFSPPSPRSKAGRFTRFIHEPHFGVMQDRGCLTCHSLTKEAAYLKSYEQGDPHKFVSGFGEVKKDLCQTCHTANMARQDCLTCHDYHVNGVVTPIMSTKLPAQ